MTVTKKPTDERDLDLATYEGRQAAGEPYASPLVPTKYHNKPELADAWFAAFMKEIKCK